jgi:predicted ATPase/DNA-binding CsgD family transcriptional regulator
VSGGETAKGQLPQLPRTALPAEEAEETHSEIPKDPSDELDNEFNPLPRLALVATPAGVVDHVFPLLPVPLTRLIGRDAEEAVLLRALKEEGARLVTVTGAGGTGKTRLALAVASVASDRFPDGVFFVDLSPLADGAMVLPAIAAALGVRQSADQPLRAALARFLAGRRMLLLLDNCEHVLDAMPDVAALLAAHPALAVLATSREPLRIRGEREFPLQPFDVPDLDHLPEIDVLARMPAVALFVERAAEYRPAFTLTSENAATIAAICHRLDGLPLALELAASRIRALPPVVLLERLEPRLPLLASGARDLPSRHRTMRDAIAWSYELLDPAEQILFRRMSVFSGGCSLSAVEFIGQDGETGASAVEEVTSLVDKGLVMATGLEAEARYTMLDTIREYGLEQLQAHQEAELARERHAHWCLMLVETASQGMRRPRDEPWLARLETEYDNARAALDWLRERESVPEALRLGAALLPFWLGRGRLSEGRDLLGALLALTAANAHDAEKAEVLLAAAHLAAAQSDFAQARSLATHAHALWRGLGDRRGMARSLLRLAAMAPTPELEAELAAESLEHYRAAGQPLELAQALADLAGFSRDRGDLVQARALLDESVALYRSLGAAFGVAWPLAGLALVSWYEGDVAQARALFAESLALFQSTGDRRGQTWATHGLGLVAWTQGELADAAALHEQALVLAEETGDRREVALLQIGLGFVAEARGASREGQQRFLTALATERDLGNTWGISMCLEGLAGVILDRQPLVAVHLLAATSAARVRFAEPLPPVYRARRDHLVQVARSRLGEDAFNTGWATGSDLTLERAISDALSTIETIDREQDAASGLVRGEADVALAVHRLTAREREILRLLAQRATDREIATALAISPRTVMHHVSSILAKLGAANRREAGRLASRLNLL